MISASEEKKTYISTLEAAYNYDVVKRKKSTFGKCSYDQTDYKKSSNQENLTEQRRYSKINDQNMEKPVFSYENFYENIILIQCEVNVLILHEFIRANLLSLRQIIIKKCKFYMDDKDFNKKEKLVSNLQTIKILNLVWLLEQMRLPNIEDIGIYLEEEIWKDLSVIPNINYFICCCKREVELMNTNNYKPESFKKQISIYDSHQKTISTPSKQQNQKNISQTALETAESLIMGNLQSQKEFLKNLYKSILKEIHINLQVYKKYFKFALNGNKLMILGDVLDNGASRVQLNNIIISNMSLIKGIVFKDNGHIRQAAFSELVKILDKIPQLNSIAFLSSVLDTKSHKELSYLIQEKKIIHIVLNQSYFLRKEIKDLFQIDGFINNIEINHSRFYVIDLIQKSYYEFCPYSFNKEDRNGQNNNQLEVERIYQNQKYYPKQIQEEINYFHGKNMCIVRSKVTENALFKYWDIKEFKEQDQSKLMDQQEKLIKNLKQIIAEDHLNFLNYGVIIKMCGHVFDQDEREFFLKSIQKMKSFECLSEIIHEDVAKTISFKTKSHLVLCHSYTLGFTKIKEFHVDLILKNSDLYDQIQTKNPGKDLLQIKGNQILQRSLVGNESKLAATETDKYMSKISKIQKPDEITTLNFQNQQQPQGDFYFLNELVKKYQKLKALNLSNCSLNDDKIKELNMEGINSSLEKLVITSNKQLNQIPFLESLLQKCSSLKYLNLSDNYLSSTSVENIDFSQFFKSLVVLDLSTCDFTVEKINQIFDHTKKLITLTYNQLRLTEINDFKQIRFPISLKSLTLKRCRFQLIDVAIQIGEIDKLHLYKFVYSPCQSIAKVLLEPNNYYKQYIKAKSLPGLKHLSQLEVTDAEIKKSFQIRCLMVNAPNLQKLFLNSIKLRNLKYCCIDKVKNLKSLQFSNLSFLNDLDILNELLFKNKSLKKFGWMNSKVEQKLIEQLRLDSIPYQLTDLDLQGISSDQNLKLINKFLTKCKLLQRLNISYYRLNDQNITFLKIDQMSTHLTDLYIDGNAKLKEYGFINKIFVRCKQLETLSMKNMRIHESAKNIQFSLAGSNFSRLLFDEFQEEVDPEKRISHFSQSFRDWITERSSQIFDIRKFEKGHIHLQTQNKQFNNFNYFDVFEDHNISSKLNLLNQHSQPGNNDSDEDSDTESVASSYSDSQKKESDSESQIQEPGSDSQTSDEKLFEQDSRNSENFCDFEIEPFQEKNENNIEVDEQSDAGSTVSEVQENRDEDHNENNDENPDENSDENSIKLSQDNYGKSSPSKYQKRKIDENFSNYTNPWFFYTFFKEFGLFEPDKIQFSLKMVSFQNVFIYKNKNQSENQNKSKNNLFFLYEVLKKQRENALQKMYNLNNLNSLSESETEQKAQSKEILSKQLPEGDSIDENYLDQIKQIEINSQNLYLLKYLMQKCKNLNFIDLSNSKLTNSMVSDFKFEQNLKVTVLDFSHNSQDLSNFIDTILRSCPDLLTLNLSSLKMETHNISFKNISLKLKVLDISKNKGFSNDQFIDLFKRCQNLKELNLKDISLDKNSPNIFHNLPSEIININLSHNIKIEETDIIGKIIFNLQKLKKLNLQNCNLSMEEIFKLKFDRISPYLEEINLSYNRIEVGQKFIAYLIDNRNLKKLDLSNQYVKQSYCAKFDLQNENSIEELNVSHNFGIISFEFVSKIIKKSKNFKKLILGNQIIDHRIFTFQFDQIGSKIKEIDISNVSSFTRIEPLLEIMSKDLVSFVAKSSEITHHFFQSLEDKKSVDIYMNLLHFDISSCQLINNLQFLETLLKNAKKLEFLNLSNLNIPSSQFQYFKFDDKNTPKNLKKFIFNQNKIMNYSFVSDLLQSCGKSLQVLSLKECDLDSKKMLTIDFKKLSEDGEPQNFQELNLKGNRLLDDLSFLYDLLKQKKLGYLFLPEITFEGVMILWNFLDKIDDIDYPGKILKINFFSQKNFMLKIEILHLINYLKNKEDKQTHKLKKWKDGSTTNNIFYEIIKCIITLNLTSKQTSIISIMVQYLFALLSDQIVPRTQTDPPFLILSPYSLFQSAKQYFQEPNYKQLLKIGSESKSRIKNEVDVYSLAFDCFNVLKNDENQKPKYKYIFAYPETYFTNFRSFYSQNSHQSQSYERIEVKNQVNSTDLDQIIKISKYNFERAFLPLRLLLDKNNMNQEDKKSELDILLLIYKVPPKKIILNNFSYQFLKSWYAIKFSSPLSLETEIQGIDEDSFENSSIAYYCYVWLKKKYQDNYDEQLWPHFKNWICCVKQQEEQENSFKFNCWSYTKKIFGLFFKNFFSFFCKIPKQYKFDQCIIHLDNRIKIAFKKNNHLVLFFLYLVFILSSIFSGVYFLKQNEGQGQCGSELSWYSNIAFLFFSALSLLIEVLIFKDILSYVSHLIPEMKPSCETSFPSKYISDLTIFILNNKYVNRYRWDITYALTFFNSFYTRLDFFKNIGFLGTFYYCDQIPLFALSIVSLTLNKLLCLVIFIYQYFYRNSKYDILISSYIDKLYLLSSINEMQSISDVLDIISPLNSIFIFGKLFNVRIVERAVKITLQDFPLLVYKFAFLLLQTDGGTYTDWTVFSMFSTLLVFISSLHSLLSLTPSTLSQEEFNDLIKIKKKENLKNYQDQLSEVDSYFSTHNSKETFLDILSTQKSESPEMKKRYSYLNQETKNQFESLKLFNDNKSSLKEVFENFYAQESTPSMDFSSKLREMKNQPDLKTIFKKNQEQMWKSSIPLSGTPLNSPSSKLDKSSIYKSNDNKKNQFDSQNEIQGNKNSQGQIQKMSTFSQQMSINPNPKLSDKIKIQSNQLKKVNDNNISSEQLLRNSSSQDSTPQGTTLQDVTPQEATPNNNLPSKQIVRSYTHQSSDKMENQQDLQQELNENKSSSELISRRDTPPQETTPTKQKVEKQPISYSKTSKPSSEITESNKGSNILKQNQEDEELNNQVSIKFIPRWSFIKSTWNPNTSS